MTSNDARKRAAARTKTALWFTTPLTTVAVVGTLLVWSLSTQLFVRRTAVVVGIVVVLACLIVLLLAKISAGRVSVAQAYSATVPETTKSSSSLPSHIPSGRSLRIRGLIGMCTVFAALLGTWALVVGDDRHATQAADIRSAGARIVQAPVTSVTDVESYSGKGDTDFSAEFTVLLREGTSADRRTSVTLKARTTDLPKAGEKLRVMYAPSNLQLGAVHGDTETLTRMMRGKAMSPGLTLGLAIAWAAIALLTVGVTALMGGLGAVTRLDRDTRALRGFCVGSKRWASGGAQGRTRGDAVQVRLSDGDSIGFVPERNATSIAEVVVEQPVWVCWKAIEVGSNDAEKTIHAALIADSGWAMQGEVLAKEAIRLAPRAVVPTQGDGQLDPARKLRLWHPTVSWPLMLRGGFVLWMVVAMTAAGACITDFGLPWRWGLGVVCNVALVAALIAYVRPATKHVPGTLRNPSMSKAP